MYKFTNKNQLSLPLAVFLVNDTYDYDDRDRAISTTAILRSIRSIVLSMQHDTLEKEVDIIDLAASKLGTAFHDACCNGQTAIAKNMIKIIIKNTNNL